MLNPHEKSLFVSYKYPSIQHLPPFFFLPQMCENLGGFSFRMLIFGRLIAGVGVGITSAAGPAFISDTGRLVEGMEMEMG